MNRRDFLKFLGAGAAAAVVLPLLPEPEVMSDTEFEAMLEADVDRCLNLAHDQLWSESLACKHYDEQFLANVAARELV